jgi:hypothetical protein
MGSGASKCPADQMMNQKRKQAIKKTYTQSKASDFYFACRDGNIDYVREHLQQMSIEDIDKLEANGDTALHVATRNEHREIVQLLVNAGCSRTTLNYDGKLAHEEIQSPEMRKIYQRPDLTHFHESDPKTSSQTYVPHDQEQVKAEKFDWIQTFETDEELQQHALKTQTTAMWFKLFNWVSHTFSGALNRTDFRANLFDLESDRDFDGFLKRAIPDEDAYQKTRDALIKAEKAKDIVPLIKLYTSEFGPGKIAFYKVLNKQLASASEDETTTAHYCDRFVYEFEMKSDQLEKRAFTGETFRGASMSEIELEVYEQLTTSTRKKGVLATKTFTSTSRKREEAMSFANENAKDNKQKRVLLVYNIPKPCNTIFCVADVSQFPGEEEVLIIPGNLFKVCCVDKLPDLTEIHLEHINTKISTFKKLSHTIKSSREKPTLE